MQYTSWPGEMSDEELVMRKRLTVEGEGGGDDRRIMSLVKTFVRYVLIPTCTLTFVKLNFRRSRELVVRDLL